MWSPAGFAVPLGRSEDAPRCCPEVPKMHSRRLSTPTRHSKRIQEGPRHTYIRTYIHAYTHIHTYICTYTHPYIHTYRSIYIHIHIGGLSPSYSIPIPKKLRVYAHMYGCVHILRGYNCRLPDAWCKAKFFILFPAHFHMVARQTKTQSYAFLELLSACRPRTNGT